MAENAARNKAREAAEYAERRRTIQVPASLAAPAIVSDTHPFDPDPPYPDYPITPADQVSDTSPLVPTVRASFAPARASPLPAHLEATCAR
jgi:hypothetical protein